MRGSNDDINHAIDGINMSLSIRGTDELIMESV